jgi:hypothetical protein
MAHSVCPEAADFFRQALERRYREVRNQFAGQPVTLPPVVALMPAEEALRLCMVRYWPRAAVADADDLQAYLARLLDCWQAAHDRADLRFFDAWNNAFEMLSRRDRPPVFESGWRQFCQCYCALIEVQLDQLTSRTGMTSHARLSGALCNTADQSI